jgi:tetratricopeptide (TPR) repeat protein
VFQVQSDIAAKVVDSLGVALAEKQEKKLASAPTANVAAYDAYLKGQEAMAAGARADLPSLRKGLAYFEQAVALDPKFSEAWAQISTCRTLLFANSVPDPAMARGAMEAARRAIELAPEKPGGQLALGIYYRTVEPDPPRALEEYKKAERLAPGTPDPLRSIGRAEMMTGRWQDAIAHYDEAERLDPKNPLNVGNASVPLLYLRRCGEARQAVDRTLALEPDNLSRISEKLWALLCEGNVAEARALVAETVRRVGPTEATAYFSNAGLDWLLDAENVALLRRLTPAAFDGDEANWAINQAVAAWRVGDSAAARDYAEKALPTFEARVRSSPRVAAAHSVLSQSLALVGRRDDAVREAIRATELDPVATSPQSGADMVSSLAWTCILAGDQEKAIDALERLLKVPYYVTPAWLAVDPWYDSLRKNPRFQKLVAPAKS